MRGNVVQVEKPGGLVGIPRVYRGRRIAALSDKDSDQLRPCTDVRVLFCCHFCTSLSLNSGYKKGSYVSALLFIRGSLVAPVSIKNEIVNNARKVLTIGKYVINYLLEKGSKIFSIK